MSPRLPQEKGKKKGGGEFSGGSKEEAHLKPEPTVGENGGGRCFSYAVYKQRKPDSTDLEKGLAGWGYGTQ